MSYIPPDIEAARPFLQGDLGPVAFAVAVQRPVLTCFPLFPQYPETPRTTATQMMIALIKKGRRPLRIRGGFPNYGLALVQYQRANNTTPARCRDWIVSDSRSSLIYDPAAGRWATREVWRQTTVGERLRDLRCVGWFLTLAFEITV